MKCNRTSNIQVEFRFKGMRNVQIDNDDDANPFQAFRVDKYIQNAMKNRKKSRKAID